MFELKDCTVEESKIAGLKIIRSKTVTDDRGTVRELYRGSLYTTFLPNTLSSWQQINLTRTKKGLFVGYMVRQWQN